MAEEFTTIAHVMDELDKLDQLHAEQEARHAQAAAEHPKAEAGVSASGWDDEHVT